MPDLRGKETIAVTSRSPPPLDYIRTADLGRTRRFFAWMDRHRRAMIILAVTVAAPASTFLLPATLTTETTYCRVCGAQSETAIARLSGVPYRWQRHSDMTYAALYQHLLEREHEHDWCDLMIVRREGTLWQGGEAKADYRFRGRDEHATARERVMMINDFAQLPVVDRRAIFDELFTSSPQLDSLYRIRDDIWLRYRNRLKSASIRPQMRAP